MKDLAGWGWTSISMIVMIVMINDINEQGWEGPCSGFKFNRLNTGLVSMGREPSRPDSHLLS